MQKNTRILTEISMAIALSLILNFIPLWQMPQGGSVTLEMLPIFFIAFRWGVRPGMMAGLGYGIIQLAFGAYIVHPVQLILDYPLAYSLLGLAGLFKNKIHLKKKIFLLYNKIVITEDIAQVLWILLAMIPAILVRFFSHVLSGVIFFAHFAPEGQNVWLYSIIYNGSFLIPSLILSYLILISLKRFVQPD